MTEEEASLEYVRRKLEANRGRVRKICREIGVPYNSIHVIWTGRVKKPYYETYRKLEEFFRNEV